MIPWYVKVFHWRISHSVRFVLSFLGRMVEWKSGTLQYSTLDNRSFMSLGKQFGYTFIRIFDSVLEVVELTEEKYRGEEASKSLADFFRRI
jgi:hypothetical protein